MAGAATLAAVAAVPVVAASTAAAALAAPAAGNTALLLRHKFTPLVQQPFQFIDGVGASTNVTLTTISDLSPEPSPGSDVRFSLMFEGATSRVVPQGTYVLRQRALGSVPVLVVPVGLPATRVRYQVIVNNPG